MASLKINTNVLVPKVPNFVKLENGDWIPLCDLTNDCIEELAEEWKEAVRKRAGEQYEKASDLRKTVVSEFPDIEQKWVAECLEHMLSKPKSNLTANACLRLLTGKSRLDEARSDAKIFVEALLGKKGK